MTIEDLHLSIRELLNIGQSQYYSPEVIDIQINTAIKDLYRQEYAEFESTQKITDKLGFYKTFTTPIGLDENNQADLPGDFYHLTGLEVVFNDDSVKNCETLKDGHWFKRKQSVAFAPSNEYPIARQIGSSKIEVLPESAAKVIMYYLRRPAVAKFGYTVNESGTGWIYDVAKSTQVDWVEIDHPRIQDKVLGLLGLSLRDDDLVRHESVKKNQNNNE